MWSTLTWCTASIHNMLWAQPLDVVTCPTKVNWTSRKGRSPGYWCTQPAFDTHTWERMARETVNSSVREGEVHIQAECSLFWWHVWWCSCLVMVWCECEQASKGLGAKLRFANFFINPAMENDNGQTSSVSTSGAGLSETQLQTQVVDSQCPVLHCCDVFQRRR